MPQFESYLLTKLYYSFPLHNNINSLIFSIFINLFIPPILDIDFKCSCQLWRLESSGKIISAFLDKIKATSYDIFEFPFTHSLTVLSLISEILAKSLYDSPNLFFIDDKNIDW